MSEISVAYGAGLFAAALSAGVDGEILFESRILGKLLTAEYLRLLSNPDIAKSERIGLIGELTDGRVQPYLASYMKLMIERSLAFEITASFAEYELLYYEHHAIVKVRAESAVPLANLQKKALHEKLTARTGKSVEIEYKVDPSLLGGVRISYAGRLIDGTVKKRLGELASTLADTVV